MFFVEMCGRLWKHEAGARRPVSRSRIRAVDCDSHGRAPCCGGATNQILRVPFVLDVQLKPEERWFDGRHLLDGLDIKAHSLCYRVTRSIAFVRSAAYQEFGG